MKKPTYLLMDIEGTTTSINFVHDTLFTYAKKNMHSFLKQHQHDDKIKACLDETKDIMEQEGSQANSLDQLIDQLCTWIEADRKVGPLKTLQGYIWREGYETGQYTSHIYKDVYPAMQKWQEMGIKLGIYSSGSVGAQKLLFAHTEQGDLTPCLSAYFDTKVGHKREVNSYAQISKSLNIAPEQILFLSDVVEELDAASEAGLGTAHVVRPGTKDTGYKKTIGSFAELAFEG